jgi:hypothetical protein
VLDLTCGKQSTKRLLELDDDLVHSSGEVLDRLEYHRFPARRGLFADPVGDDGCIDWCGRVDTQEWAAEREPLAPARCEPVVEVALAFIVEMPGMSLAAGAAGSRSQKPSRTAPGASSVRANRTSTLAAPRRFDHSTSPMPSLSNNVSLITSLLSNGRRSSRASARASVVLPLPGRPETTT